MRFATVRHAGRLAFGPIDGDSLIDVADRFASPAAALTLDDRGLVACHGADGRRIPLDGAVFALAGAWFRRPLIFGLVFAFGWESFVLLIPGYLKRFSVAYYLQALVPHAMPQDSSISSLLQVLQETPPVWASLASLIVITLAGLWLAGRAVEKREYVLEQ